MRANARRAVVALLVLMAMLIAPVCTPLCAAKTCSSGTVQTEECHSPGAMADTAADRCAAPMKACAARELAAVLFRTNERLVQKAQAQHINAQWNMDRPDAVADSRVIFRAPVLRWGEDRFVLTPASSLLKTTHLRF